MSDGSIEDALKITLADYRLSRGEKRALAKVVEKFADDEHQLALSRHHAFKIARDEVAGPEAIALIDWLEDVVKVLHPQRRPGGGRDRSTAYFSPDQNCVRKIVSLFEAARRQVDVCVFTITDDRLTDAMIAAHRRGVTIRVISDNHKSEDLGSDIDMLERQGLPVRVDRSEYHMHHKYAVFDNGILLTGSYNWTRSASRNNEENFIVTEDDDLVEAFLRQFQELWDQLA